VTPAQLSNFWAKVDKSANCWAWLGKRLPQGYGQWWVPRGAEPAGRSRGVLAHRFVYELARGPIPDGYQIDHLCNTPWCVNPDHLQPVTQAENLRRREVRRRERGYAYPPRRRKAAA
jgi:hypothetical protein